VNLEKERLTILRSISHESEISMIYDPLLKDAIRHIISDIESLKNDTNNLQKIRENLNTLKKLYLDHGPPMFRCIFEFSYLLHSTFDIKSLFEVLVKLFIDDLDKNDRWVTPVINELNKYAYSPYDTTQRLIILIIDSGKSLKTFYSDILNNSSSPFSLKLETSKIIAKFNISHNFNDLIRFVKITCRSNHADDFISKILPVVEVISSVGEIIVNDVIDEFLKEAHGPLIIASFEDNFHNWFKENYENITPNRHWVRVLSQSWNRSKFQHNRDKMLSVMINEWAMNPNLAAIVRDVLSTKIRQKPTYFEPAGSGIKDLALKFVKNESSSTLNDLIIAILAASEKSPEEWNKFVSSLPKDRLTGWGFAKAFQEANENQQFLFFEYIVSNTNKKIVSSFLNILMEKNRFVRLSLENQNKILSINNISYYVKIEDLTPLMRAKIKFHPKVIEKLQNIYNSLIEFQKGYSTSIESNFGVVE
jgi:hypothetical protein